MYTEFPPSSPGAGPSRLRVSLDFPLAYPPSSAPPQFQALGSPYTRIPLPALEYLPAASQSPAAFDNISLNPILNFNNFLRFDIGLGTEFITSLPTFTAIHPRVLAEPCTRPGLPYLTIVSQYLPWAIVARPRAGHGTVTVGDVFNSIYLELHKRVSDDELSSLHAPREQRQIIEASRRRVTPPSPGSPLYHTWPARKDNVVRRVDFFFGATKFVGLTRRGGGMDLWELNVTYF